MMDHTDLIGTWKFTRDERAAFLHFTYTQAFDYLQDGDQRQVLRLWYALEDPELIRFRSQPADEGWTCGIKVEGDTLTIAGDDLNTVCVRAEPEDIPKWFVQELARGI
jgi:hypothetical protein